MQKVVSDILTAASSTMVDELRADAEFGELPSITYDDGETERVVYSLPPAFGPDADSILFFTAPKSGTVMLSLLLGCLAPHAGLNFVYIIGEFFKLGIPPTKAPASTSAIFLPKGYCYGFPYLPSEFEIPIIGRVKTLLLVRDPRDMLVSLYYSVRSSHPEPGSSVNAVNAKITELPGRRAAQTMDIDEFLTGYIMDDANCNSIENYRDLLREYRELSVSGPVKLFRYEDVIYDKAGWVADICAYLGWNISAEIQRDAVARVDIFPGSEQQDEHIRQVHPGNYKSKLKIETIRLIEDICAEEMAFFGYERYCPSTGKAG